MSASYGHGVVGVVGLGVVVGGTQPFGFTLHLPGSLVLEL